MMAHLKPLKRKDLLYYSAFALPIAFASMPLYIFAPDYYTTEHSISLTTLGLALLFLRLVDAFQDPIIGSLCDRTPSKQPLIIIISSLVLAFSFILLFSPPSSYSLAWFIVFMFLATTAYSICSINLNTLGGLWSKSSNQKTRITTYREFLSILGLVIAVSLPAILNLFVSKYYAFFITGITLLFLTFLSIVAFSYWAKHSYIPRSTPTRLLSINWLPLRKLDSHTKYFYFIYALSMLASSIPAILVIFFIRDRLDAEPYTGFFLTLYFISGAFGMPLWQKISKAYDKYSAWLGSMVLAIFGFIWVYYLGEGDLWQYAVICVISGIAFGADLSLPPSILADHIHHYKKEICATVYFSVLTFIIKITIALSSVIVFPIIEYFGYVAAAKNSETALFALSISYSIIPIILKVIAVFLMWKLLINNKKGTPYEKNINRFYHRSNDYV